MAYLFPLSHLWERGWGRGKETKRRRMFFSKGGDLLSCPTLIIASRYQ